MATTPLYKLAKVFRSKNASPFLSTIDIFFDDKQSYEHVKGCGALTPEAIASVYRIPVEDVVMICYHGEAKGIKVTIIKPGRVASGDAGSADVFGCQQYIPLLSFPIPQAKR